MLEREPPTAAFRLYVARPERDLACVQRRDVTLRQIVLALLVAGMVGLAAELLLLEHFDSWQQWIPLVMLALGVPAAIVLWRAPSPRTIRVFRQLMSLMVVTGALGLYLHLQGNIEFALERDPGLRGIGLLWKAMRGATPTLAPGALAQLGLLGLAYTFRHPTTTHEKNSE